MTDLIMQLAGVMQRDIDQLMDVSHNVANANSPGYKSARAFNVFNPALATQNIDQALASVHAQSYIDPVGGALHVTGRVSDLALDGDAWFVLRTPDGPMLTRDGRFRVDPDGYLVSDRGYPVMGESGPLHVVDGLLKVNASGVVQVDGREVGQIRLVRSSTPQALQSMGHGLYTATSRLQPAKDYVVHQGMQERSNTALGNDMVKMMEITRHVESMQRAISAYDGLLDRGINQLGKD